MSTPVSSGQHTPASTEAKHLLTVPGQGQYSQSPLPNRLKNVPGYSTPVFKGKEEQRAKVQANVAAKVSRPFHRCRPLRWSRGRIAPFALVSHWIAAISHAIAVMPAIDASVRHRME